MIYCILQLLDLEYVGLGSALTIKLNEKCALEVKTQFWTVTVECVAY